MTPFGKKMLSQLNLIKEEIDPDDEKYIKMVREGHKNLVFNLS